MDTVERDFNFALLPFAVGRCEYFLCDQLLYDVKIASHFFCNDKLCFLAHLGKNYASMVFYAFLFHEPYFDSHIDYFSRRWVVRSPSNCARWSGVWAIGLRTHTHLLPFASCYWLDCFILSYQFGFAISYSYAFYSIVPAKNFPCMAQNFGLKILQIVITNLLW